MISRYNFFHEVRMEQEYERKTNYRKFFEHSAKALIALLFMEDIHNEYDYKTFRLIWGPPSDSVDELKKFYQENKNKSREECGHDDYDEDINKIYNLWKETLKGEESIDEQISLLESVYFKAKYLTTCVLCKKEIEKYDLLKEFIVIKKNEAVCCDCVEVILSKVSP